MYSPDDQMQATRTLVVAALILYRGQILVAQRKRGDSGAGYWEFPGGKVEPGESLEQATKREIQEELEMPISVQGLLDSHDVQTPTQKWIRLNLIAAEAQNPHFVLHDHDQAKWVKFEDLEDIHFLPGNKKFFPAIQKYFEVFGQVSKK